MANNQESIERVSCENSLGGANPWLRSDCVELFENSINPVATRIGKRAKMMRFSINQAWSVRQRYPEAHFLEFGVHKGEDICRMAVFLAQKERQATAKKESVAVTIHGFDSFQGLPEAWENGQYENDQDGKRLAFDVGKFDTGGVAPQIELLKQKLLLDTTSCNVEFHAGWFADTVPVFFASNGLERPVAFLHADADLYSSTITFLEEICRLNLLVKGSVVCFDEFWNYENWQEGEYKAWAEICSKHEIDFRYLSYHAPAACDIDLKTRYGYQSVSIVVTS